MKVKEAMVSNVFTCTADTKLDVIALMMWHNDFGCVPVVDDKNKPVGIITDRDIAMGAALQYKPLWEIPAFSVCEDREVYCCKSGDDVQKAVGIMQNHSVRRLPVTSRGKLVGIVSLGDIVACSDVAKGAGLPLSEMAGMLTSVSAHHAPLRLPVLT